MALELYRRKRDFKVTPEPAGRVVKARKGKALAFVVQKHAARRLHYDFRLELNGVLLSWAVPKGPSLDPKERRLAMQTEDHPLEYGDFEGIIPPKQYGAGTVLLWDRGTWEPREDPVRGHEQGKLKFTLHGEKLRGGWTLVRTRGSRYEGEKSWLLIKEADEHARPASEYSIVADQAGSVATGRGLEEIAAEADQEWHSNRSVADNVREISRRKGSRTRKAHGVEAGAAKLEGARKSPMPAFIEPQLATLVREPVEGDRWLHEMKYDGYRMLCRIEGAMARMYSRNGKDWTGKFSSVARAAARLPVANAWLDGEVVIMGEDGRSSFQALQNALAEGAEAAYYYYLFDLPYLGGHDLRKAPLRERKALLEELLAAPPGMLRYSSHVVGQGREFLEQASRMQLEGVVSKQVDAPYTAGRSRTWVKVKCVQRQEMVIGGYTDPEGSRSGFGALLLGVYERDGSLRYSGKVGTGFDGKSLASVHAKLRPLATERPPFSNPPTGAEGRRAHWVRPELVAEVAFTEWTNDGTLRHPSFQGLREDKKASDVVRERPATAQPPSQAGDAGAAGRPARRASRAAAAGRSAASTDNVVAGVTIGNPGKLLYPEAKLSKLDLARYYEAVGEWILPQVRNRPLTMVRCPNGWDRKCFYQKNAHNGVPDSIERVEVRTSEGPALYMMANSLAAVIATVQMGVLELHPWGSTAGRLEFPDRIILDLDPSDELAWEKVVEAAHLLRTLLEELGLRGFLKTTGGKGLHVVLPIRPQHRWDAIKGFTRAIAELLFRTFPDRFTPKITKSARRGRIFIDYLRNDEGSTAVAAYSLRARANAPVATPIGWDELDEDVRFDYFNARNVPERLARMKRDPWAEFLATRQSVTAAMMKKVGCTP